MVQRPPQPGTILNHSSGFLFDLFVNCCLFVVGSGEKSYNIFVYFFTFYFQTYCQKMPLFVTVFFAQHNFFFVIAIIFFPRFKIFPPLPSPHFNRLSGRKNDANLRYFVLISSWPRLGLACCRHLLGSARPTTKNKALRWAINIKLSLLVEPPTSFKPALPLFKVVRSWQSA